MEDELTPMASLTQTLCRALLRPVTRADRARASLHLLDWLACAIAALPSPVAIKLRATAQRWSSAGPCTGLGVGGRDWQSALWLNAGLGNVEEMDDVHRTSILHPGPVVIPAALAIAEHTGAGPAQLLDAIVRGYDVAIRVGRALGQSHYRYYHNTASCGTFGAAAAVASVLNLSAEQMTWALGNAGSRTGGLWQLRNEAVDTKQFHTVDAALTGTLAALMAAEGVTGPAQILEGPQGLFAATAPAAAGAALLEDLTGPWLIYDCSFKPWPACRHVHASIDAMRALVAQHALAPEQVAGVQVSTYADALTFCDRPCPETKLQAKFSLQHAVAVVLRDQTPAFAHFTAPLINAPDLVALRQRVSVREDPELTHAYPNQFGARVRVECRDGRQLRAAVSHAWGDPANPLSAADLGVKASQLLATVNRDAAPLIAAVAAIADETSLNPLRACLASLQLAPLFDGAVHHDPN